MNLEDNHIIMVSISCITYNHASFIRQCLEGFMMQECDFDFEVLIHDDASTDGTQEIIKEYQQKFPDIIKPIYQKENQYSKGVRGMMARFNFPRARGKYIALCEGDDYWTDPLKLQKQVDFLEKTPECAGCFHDVKNVDADNKIIKENYYTPELIDFNQKETLKMGSSYATCSLVFRRKCVETTPEWYLKIGSDQALDLVITELGYLHYISDNMGAYRIHSDGIWQGNTLSENMKVVLKRYLVFYDVPKYRELYGDIIKSSINSLINKRLKESKGFSDRVKMVNPYYKIYNLKGFRAYLFCFRKIVFPKTNEKYMNLRRKLMTI